MVILPYIWNIYIPSLRFNKYVFDLGQKAIEIESNTTYPAEWDRNFENDLERLLNHPNISLKWDSVGTQFLHIKIKKGRLYAAFPESMAVEHHPILFMLQRVLCMYTVSDTELMINVWDGGKVLHSDAHVFPLFSWAKSERFADLLMPYWSFAWIPWCGDKNATYDIETEWKRKKSKAYWRGSATGGDYTLENWREFPRSKLSIICQKRRDVCDAGIVQCSQCSEEATREMNSSIGFKERAPRDAFNDYKIAILLDGNTAPSSRALEYFASTSLILWQKTTEFEFFYHSLEPYEHYIPLSEDLCDVFSKIDWALLHNEEHAKAVIANHLAFSSKYLCTDAITFFMAKSLNKYAASFPIDAIELTNRDIDFMESIRNQTYVYRYFQDYMGGRCINAVL